MGPEPRLGRQFEAKIEELPGQALLKLVLECCLPSLISPLGHEEGEGLLATSNGYRDSIDIRFLDELAALKVKVKDSLKYLPLCI